MLRGVQLNWRMAFVMVFMKIFVICLLEMAAGDTEEKVPAIYEPKNIILILSGGMSFEAMKAANFGLVSQWSNGSSSSHMWPFKEGHNHGFFKLKVPDNMDEIISNIQPRTSEGKRENSSQTKSSSSIMSLAQSAGKATGLVTTRDVRASIFATIYSIHLVVDPISVSDTSCKEAVDQLHEVWSNMDVIYGKAAHARYVNNSSQQHSPKFLKKQRSSLNKLHLTNDECSFIPEKSILKLQNQTNRILLKDMGELKTQEKMKGKKVVGLFSEMDTNAMKVMMSSALEILKRKNGFFLLVMVNQGTPVDNVQMVSVLIQDLLESNFFNNTETMVMITSDAVEIKKRNRNLCSRNTDVQTRIPNAYDAAYVKNNFSSSFPSKIEPLQKNVTKINKEPLEMPSQKTSVKIEGEESATREMTTDVPEASSEEDYDSAETKLYDAENLNLTEPTVSSSIGEASFTLASTKMNHTTSEEHVVSESSGININTVENVTLRSSLVEGSGTTESSIILENQEQRLQQNGTENDMVNSTLKRIKREDDCQEPGQYIPLFILGSVPDSLGEINGLTAVRKILKRVVSSTSGSQFNLASVGDGTSRAAMSGFQFWNFLKLGGVSTLLMFIHQLGYTLFPM